MRPLEAQILLGATWWHAPLISAGAALFGVVLAQSVLLWIYHRDERRRGDPELLKQCASFSVALGRIKRALHEGRPLDSLDKLEDASQSLNIIAPDEILVLVDEIVGDIGSALMARNDGDPELREQCVTRIFHGHMSLTQAVRAHFNQPARTFRAVPMIESHLR